MGRKAARLLITILTFAGGAGLMAWAWLTVSAQLPLLINGETTSGEVTGLAIPDSHALLTCNGGACYHPVVTITSPGGHEHSFTSTFGDNPATHRIGDTVPVLWAGGDGIVAEVNDPIRLWGIPGAVGAIGLIMAIFGVFSATHSARRWTGGLSTISGEPVRERSEAWLRRHGTKLTAEIIGVVPTMRGGNGQKLGWEITARGLGPHKQKTYTFRSAPLGTDPTGQIGRGDSISVLVDPDNPKQYWVDVAEVEAAIHTARYAGS